MTRMRIFGILTGFCLLSLVTLGQKAPAVYEKEYESGLQALRREDYTKARSLLGPLTYSRHAHDLAPLAHYFYALASLRGGQPADARRTLQQALERFPNWNKRSEMYYLLGHAAFADKDPAEALKALEKVDDPLLDADVTALKIRYLSRLTDGAALRRLQRDFPEDALVATYLVRAIRKTVPTASKAELDLADRLARRFGERPTSTPSTPSPVPTAPTRAPERGKKAVYNVSVLFPFRIETLDALNRADGNQYAVDLYEGIRLAAQKLSDEGIKLNVQAYDLENSAQAATDLTNNAVFQQTDLLIGPLHSETHRIVSAWAATKGIPLVSPLASNRQLVADFPLQFLARPSWETQGRQAAEFARTHFGKGLSLVVYGPSRTDSLLAAGYFAALRAARADVLPPVRLVPDRASTFSALRAQLGSRRPVALFAAITQRDTGPALLTALRRSNLEAPVLLPADAFDIDTSLPTSFSGPDVYLLDPDFIDASKSSVREFRKLYFNRIHTIPTVHAMRGYDLMLFFGHLLGQYGTAFPKSGLGRVDSEQAVLAGFDYRSTNDNQALPILKHDSYRFVPVK